MADPLLRQPAQGRPRISHRSVGTTTFDLALDIDDDLEVDHGGDPASEGDEGRRGAIRRVERPVEAIVPPHRIDDLDRQPPFAHSAGHSIRIIDIAHQDRRNLRLDAGLDDSGIDDRAGLQQHRIEQRAEIRLVDAHLLAHHPRGVAQLPSRDGGSLRDPPPGDHVLNAVRRPRIETRLDRRLEEFAGRPRRDDLLAQRPWVHVAILACLRSCHDDPR